MAAADEAHSSPPAVRFIRDEPADDDFFSTHTRLAEAIVTAVRENAEIKVIGLLGRWGSGKSTVAKKVIEILTAPKDSAFLVFSYDAWLHQSDPIRRSFLESLLSTLVSSDAISRGKWDGRLKELSGEIHDTDTVETPTLSDDARWLLASLVLVPVGVGLIGLDTIKDAFGSSTTSAGIATFWAAALLLSMPLWVWLFRYVLHRPWKSEPRNKAGGMFSRGFWRIVDAEGKPTSLLPLFLNKAVRRTSTRTFRSADPSSLEFGRTFQAIMKEATGADRRFVIVIDNLDRVAASEALQMWATIRSFFLAAHETDGLAHEPYHPTVILPIDRHAIEQMFGIGDNDKNLGRDRAASFISKTFDVTFEVTEPVTSDWRTFLEQQMREVFGPLFEARWGFWTRRIFEQERPQGQATVTPREINKLVNSIGALFLQWHDQGIAVEVMSLFVIRRKEFEDRLLAFLQDTETELARDVPNWKLQLAALYHGVPLDKAAQVLLEKPIRDTIAKLDREEFASLPVIPGFGETLEMVTANLPPSADGSAADFMVVTNAALLLASLPQSAEVWEAAAWANLTEQFLRLEEGPTLAPADFPARIDCVAARIPAGHESDFCDSVASQIGALLSRDEMQAGELSPIRGAGSTLIDYAKKQELGAPLFEIDGDAPFFLKRLSQVSHRKIWTQIRTTLDADALHEGLIAMLRSTATHTLAPEAIRALVGDEEGDLYGGKTLIAWTGIAEVAAEIVRTPEAHGVTAGPGVTALGHLARTSKEARSVLVAIIDEGVMATRLDQLHEEKRWDSLYSVAALLIWRGATFSPPSGARWAAIIAAKPDLVASVLRRLRLFLPGTAMERVWNSYHAGGSSRELSEAIIQHMIETGDLGEVNLAQVLNDIHRYRNPVPWRLRDRFMNLLRTRDNFWDKLEEAPIGQALHDVASVVAKNGSDPKERVHEIVQQQVEGADAEAWTKALMEGAQPFEMATGFLEPGSVRMGKASTLFAVLSAQVESMATGADRGVRERWFSLVRLLLPMSAKSLFRILGKRLMSAAPKQTLSVIKAGGPDFLKAAGFGAEPGQSVERILLPQLRTKDGREWLKDNRQDLKAWVDKSPQPVRDLLDLALRKHAESSSEERRYSADLIRRGLGFSGP